MFFIVLLILLSIKELWWSVEFSEMCKVKNQTWLREYFYKLNPVLTFMLRSTFSLNPDVFILVIKMWADKYL